MRVPSEQRSTSRSGPHVYKPVSDRDSFQPAHAARDGGPPANTGHILFYEGLVGVKACVANDLTETISATARELRAAAQHSQA